MSLCLSKLQFLQQREHALELCAWRGGTLSFGVFWDVEVVFGRLVVRRLVVECVFSSEGVEVDCDGGATVIAGGGCGDAFSVVLAAVVAEVVPTRSKNDAAVDVGLRVSAQDTLAQV